MSHPALPMLFAAGSEDPASAVLAVLTTRNQVPESVRAAFAINSIESERSSRRRADAKLADELHKLAHAGLLVTTNQEKLASIAPTVKGLLDKAHQTGSSHDKAVHGATIGPAE